HAVRRSQRPLCRVRGVLHQLHCAAGGDAGAMQGVRERSMFLPRFSLASLLVFMTAGGLLLAANVRHRFIVSVSQDNYGLSGLAEIRVRSGWPFHHRSQDFLLPKENVREF